MLGGHRSQLGGDGLGAIGEVGIVDDLGDQSDRRGLGRSQRGVGEQDAQRLPQPPHQLRESDRGPAIGCHPDPHGPPGEELGRLRGDHNVGGADQSESAATGREPLYGGDHRYPQLDEAAVASCSQAVASRR